MRLGIKACMSFRFSCVVCVASLAVCCLVVVRPGLFQKRGETESPPAQEEAVALQKDPLEAYAWKSSNCAACSSASWTR